MSERNKDGIDLIATVKIKQKDVTGMPPVFHNTEEITTKGPGSNERGGIRN